MGGDTVQGARSKARAEAAKIAQQKKKQKQAKAKMQRMNDAAKGKTVYHLSMGHKIHAITFDKSDKSIQVKLYVKKQQQGVAAIRMVHDYNYMLFLDTVREVTCSSWTRTK
jgi:hypothetical protein